MLTFNENLSKIYRKVFYLIFSIFVIAHSHTTSCQAAELALDLEE